MSTVNSACEAFASTRESQEHTDAGWLDQLDGIAHLEEPTACTEPERREFARLVRRGFRGSDEGLDGRIRAARWLAFYYAAADTLAGIAGLKAPGERYRVDVFRKAGAGVSPVDYELELGWVFVDPAYRGHRIGESLCRSLLARVPASCVFATTRPDNASMIRILSALGFARVGKPYPRRDEELVLFLRSLRGHVPAVDASYLTRR